MRVSLPSKPDTETMDDTWSSVPPSPESRPADRVAYRDRDKDRDLDRRSGRHLLTPVASRRHSDSSTDTEEEEGKEEQGRNPRDEFKASAETFDPVL